MAVQIVEVKIALELLDSIEKQAREYLGARSMPIPPEAAMVLIGAYREHLRMQWQPMETAPRDGSRILAYGKLGFETDNGIGTVCWCTVYSEWQCDPNEASEYSTEACELTHWMPLPKPPAQNENATSPDPWAHGRLGPKK
jgi:hypothetical protein